MRTEKEKELVAVGQQLREFFQRIGAADNPEALSWLASMTGLWLPSVRNAVRGGDVPRWHWELYDLVRRQPELPPAHERKKQALLAAQNKVVRKPGPKPYLIERQPNESAELITPSRFVRDLVMCATHEKDTIESWAKRAGLSVMVLRGVIDRKRVHQYILERLVRTAPKNIRTKVESEHHLMESASDMRYELPAQKLPEVRECGAGPTSIDHDALASAGVKVGVQRGWNMRKVLRPIPAIIPRPVK
jgi:hypothetical protein